jgi:hypothetical protein
LDGEQLSALEFEAELAGVGHCLRVVRRALTINGKKKAVVTYKLGPTPAHTDEALARKYWLL